MMTLIRRFLEWLRSIFWNKEMEISVVGLQGSGKTTFINLISTGTFYENTVSTIGFNMRKITKGKVTIKVWDIGGQPRFRTMWERYCRGVDVIIFMVDAANNGKFEESKEELHHLMNMHQLAFTPLLVLGNKNDISNAVDADELIDILELRAIKMREVCCYSVSCKDQNNIDVTLKWLTQHARQP